MIATLGIVVSSMLSHLRVGAQTSNSPPVTFTNWTFGSGFVSLENFGGHGVQVADINGDGWLDVYVTHIFDPAEDRPDLLFVNQAQDPPRLMETGVGAGVADDGFFGESSEESHAAVWADLDNDGDLDLFNAHTWNGHDRLYRNEGDGRFVDMTESAGIEVTDIGTRGVAAADMDGDGLVDLVVSAWQDAQPIIYWNQGGMRFERRRINGVDNRGFANQGITVVDFDQDQRPDVALSAFEFLLSSAVGPVALLRNESPRFVDRTDFAGIVYEQTSSDPRGSNGWSFADLDNDGFLDALVTGFHGSKLYRNNGEGRFHLIARFEGVHYTGAFGDVDNDGDLDLYLAGDDGIYINDGLGGLAFRGGMGLSGIGEDARSAVFADMNNDGALDLLIASKQGPNTFFLNQSSQGGWLKLDLVASTGERGAIGARVEIFESGHLEDPEFLRGLRVVQAATGYCSQDPSTIHFGIDPSKAYDVRVVFPDGTVRTRAGVRTGEVLVIDARLP